MKSWLLTEQIARDAARRGVFDELPGRGKPQELDALVGLDEDARQEASLRATTGPAGLELELRREVAALRERLESSDLDDVARAALRQELVDKCVRLSIVHESNGHRLLANSALDFMPG